jgi:REP element-mobilizing transposase RayT
MGRKLREEGPDTVHFITNRCFQRRFFFRPGPKVNAIILGCLAWAAQRHDVRVFCYVFMSNHFHAMVQAVHMNCSDFMGSFKAELARRLNKLYGREGTLYAGRFKAEPVIGDEAMIERMRYILCNPVAIFRVVGTCFGWECRVFIRRCKTYGLWKVSELKDMERHVH